MGKSKVEIKSNPIEVATMEIGIVGETPLLMEKFSDASRQQLLNIAVGKGREKRKNRDMNQEVKDKIHQANNGKPGFPACAFKKAMVEAAVYIDGMDKKRVRGSLFVIGDVVPIAFKKMTVNKAVGRDKGINRAPREIWRPEFQGWSTTLTIKYNAAQVTPDQVVELLKLAGFHIGIGGWRPQCDGQYGMFRVRV